MSDLEPISAEARRRRGVLRTTWILIAIVLGLYGWFIMKGISGALQQ
jgi:hypothetical protein